MAVKGIEATNINGNFSFSWKGQGVVLKSVSFGNHLKCKLCQMSSLILHKNI